MPVVPATAEAVKQAAQALANGEIVAFPTETVYGLGANALDARAVAKVFAAKERPRFNPLIVHVPDLDASERYAVMNNTARRLAEAFWPGPLSLVLKKRPACGIADLVSAGLDTIALRAPAHPVAQSLLAEVKLPIAAPSANRSGRVSPTTADHVQTELGNLPAMILDGGPCPLGIESTVVSVIDGEPGLLRPGALPREAIELVLGAPLATAKANHRGASPGQLETHYAPSTRLRLGATGVRSNEALLAFGPHAPKGARATINLSQSGNLEEAAAKLFAALRELDQTGAATIAVMPIPAYGLGEAINDRLQRAANRG
ncbi:MAG TPA: L-threonylcarbamoyladenylate synthase [Methyloceanibacter sp.]|jgi:L-threonylcarbamoyladenylate synthase|nr:L-threonylcarbamoyladenylate synthase [Methyloceanibacter sp.]